MNIKSYKYLTIPLICLRDIVVYPCTMMTLFIGRKESIKSLKIAMNGNQEILFTAQKNILINKPDINDIFKIGTVSIILQTSKLLDGTYKVLIEGLFCAKIIKFLIYNYYYFVKIKYLNIKKSNKNESNILYFIIVNQFKKYIKLTNKRFYEITSSFEDIEDTSEIIDIIIHYLPLKLSDKQYLLEIDEFDIRGEYLMSLIELEIEFIKIEKRISYYINNKIKKNQREYFLNQKIKAIKKELNNINNNNYNEYYSLENKIKSIKMSIEAEKKIKFEFKKLKMMTSLSPEAVVVHSYIECILSLPWCSYTKINNNLLIAQNILNKDNYGIKKVKNLILEYLSVQIKNKKIKGSIICLIGPPGVGKTCLAKSIARAMGRKYIRMSLGGLRDEAEIKGHRRTYIGSMPGKIIQQMIKVGVKNPLFLLDEIDKMSSDIRNNPYSALLDVLDFEQNMTFNDHYLEIDYDLSNVMFLATSNSKNIPAPLLDRMEIIYLSGYTENEKLKIARKHLIPKQLKLNSLKKNELIIDNKTILYIIRYYTRESGVRNLEREIFKICRKIIKIFLINKNIKYIYINHINIFKFLGFKYFNYEKSDNNKYIGRVTGLAWTELGGELLTIETTCINGKGKLIFTGSLGDVMQESIQTSLTVMRIIFNKLNINNDFYINKDIHLHVPSGSIPKDGPSAGIAIFISLISSFFRKPIMSNIAMTGEITLHGKILPIGGLKEKILAAYRGNVKIIIIPHGNNSDLADIDNYIKNKLTIYTVRHISEVLNIIF